MKEPNKIAARAAREERLRSALRENLKRRKAQLRGRGPDASDNLSGEAEQPASAAEKPEPETS